MMKALKAEQKAAAAKAKAKAPARKRRRRESPSLSPLFLSSTWPIAPLSEGMHA